MDWIKENIASIVLLLVVIAIAYFAVRGKIKERKKGDCGCGCSNCSACAACSIARKKQEKNHETK